MIYIDTILTELRKEGLQIRDEDVEVLSSFIHDHINMLGRYSFVVPEAVLRGELRPFHNNENP